MAQPPILALADVSLTFGGEPLFAGASLAVGSGERVGVVGRNGSGKSTLLKIAAGMVEPDAGSRFVQPGAKVSYLPQEPDLSGYATLGDFVAADLDPDEGWRAEIAMEGLAVRAGAPVDGASGGERRRAALSRLIAGEPDLMLLDEPTNHLDVAAIEWLEGFLGDARAGCVMISHDRALMAKITQTTLWVDRGQVRRLDRGFSHFEAWRDRMFEEEEAERHKLDRLIRQEAKWAVEGISARRTRNQGRLRRLGDLRAERRAQVARPTAAALALAAGESSGKLVAEARGVSKSYEGRAIVREFSTRIARGDRLALVGPNGAGKTTLLRLLTGEIEPDEGTVRLGTNLRVARFDQNRAALDLDASLWETLTGDAELGVSGANDQILVRGRPKHIVGYLKEFLFDERQARGPVRALSGGERARLLMAKLMAKESNLLVLDEPTNDLDVETLDLLQELLADYDGTAILVSHDRDFLDRVATGIVAWEGEGRWTEYAGGWTDHLAQKRAPTPVAAAPRRNDPPRAERPVASPRGAVGSPAAKRGPKLTFSQSRRLGQLPAEIDRLGFEVNRLETFLSDPGLYARDPRAFDGATAELAARRKALAAAEDEWLELEELREAAGG